jgi:hypothetical protein
MRRLRAMTMLRDGSIAAAGDSTECEPGQLRRSDGWMVVMPSDERRGLQSFGPIRSDCIGGAGVDEIHGIAAAPDGSVWVTGLTDSPDFPVTVTGAGTRPTSDLQAFVAQIDPKTGKLIVAALLGANVDPRRDIARGYAIALSRDGRVFAAGEATGGTLFQATAGAFRAGQSLASTDVYVVSLR